MRTIVHVHGHSLRTGDPQKATRQNAYARAVGTIPSTRIVLGQS